MVIMSFRATFITKNPIDKLTEKYFARDKDLNISWIAY